MIRVSVRGNGAIRVSITVRSGVGIIVRDTVDELVFCLTKLSQSYHYGEG